MRMKFVVVVVVVTNNTPEVICGHIAELKGFGRAKIRVSFDYVDPKRNFCKEIFLTMLNLELIHLFVVGCSYLSLLSTNMTKIN